MWHYDSHGRYSVKSGYRLEFAEVTATASSSSNVVERCWEKLWHMPLLRKVRVFVWHILNNYLPIKMLICRRAFRVPTMCLRCDLNCDENPHHVFFGCQKSKQIQLASSVYDYQSEFCSLTFQDAISFFWHVDDGSLGSIFLILCWWIWWDRNKVLFESVLFGG